MSVGTVFETNERLICHDGRLFLFRDIYVNETLYGCQYAVRDKSDLLIWHDCAEGAAFEDVQPLVVVDLAIR
ncbi:MAG TPA: hypothetical protein VGU45_01600 [Microvirga sp.]|jgi:hypothetical protein|nr:hypothetical protein [Microvirga sp.]